MEKRYFGIKADNYYYGIIYFIEIKNYVKLYKIKDYIKLIILRKCSL